MKTTEEVTGAAGEAGSQAPAGAATIRRTLDSIDPAFRIPFAASTYYRSLALSEDPDLDPISAQFVPRLQEAVRLPYEDPDPISDRVFMKAPRLVHRYHDRALILVNDRCAVYCRHCFRRHFTGNSHGRITPAETEAIRQVLAGLPQVQEILLSGGDPLMSPDAELEALLSVLDSVNPDYTYRIATRMPVVQPQRITDALVNMLASHGSMWMVIHTNYPREISGQFVEAIARVRRAGIPVLNQAVLLRGVNDNVETLAELSRGLLRAGVKPYYLFQGDLAAGTSHFRTPIRRGLELMDALRSRVSGMGIPTYAVDLPGGGGKVPLTWDSIRDVRDGFYVIRGGDGKDYFYPVEDQQ